MEKRLGVIAVLVTHKRSVPVINSLLSEYSDIIYARQGLPMHEKEICVISLIVEGDTDTIGALTGKIGRCEGVEVKSILTKYKENDNEHA